MFLALVDSKDWIANPMGKAVVGLHMHKIGLFGSLSYVVANSQQCMPLQTIIVNTIFDLLVVKNSASTKDIKVNFKPVNS
jgi:hypothetical protein